MTKQQVYTAAGLSRQGYYNAKARHCCQQGLEQAVLSQVLAFRRKQANIGSRVMYHMLKIDCMGINRFEELLSDNHLCVQLKRKYIRTTHGVPEEQDRNYIHGYVLFDINQVVVGDITYYYNLKGEVFYIIALKDAYSKRVVGIDAFQNMYAEHALSVLEQMIELRGMESLRGTIHHTDAGGQYKSNIYKARLNECHMIQSISDNCLENGIAEQLNFIVKEQQLDLYNVRSLSHLKGILKEVQHFLNHERPVKRLQYKTPHEFEQWIATIDIADRPTQELYDFRTNKK